MSNPLYINEFNSIGALMHYAKKAQEELDAEFEHAVTFVVKAYDTNGDVLGTIDYDGSAFYFEPGEGED